MSAQQNGKISEADVVAFLTARSEEVLAAHPELQRVDLDVSAGTGPRQFKTYATCTVAIDGFFYSGASFSGGLPDAIQIALSKAWSGRLSQLNGGVH